MLACWRRGCSRTPTRARLRAVVISPVLSNIYLHEVVDEWFHCDVRPRLHGRSALVRYADDLVMVFAQEEDARRVLAVLPKRFGKYGLALHPDKTRLLDFLGLTHHWGHSRSKKWIVQQRTAKDRFSRSLHRVRDWCRDNRHEPLARQQQQLASKLRGTMSTIPPGRPDNRYLFCQLAHGGPPAFANLAKTRVAP